PPREALPAPGGDLSPPHPLAAHAGRPASATAIYARLHRPDLRQLPGTTRRPPVRRRPSHRGGARPPERPLRRRDRTAKGQDAERAGAAELRDAQPGTVSQGAPPDAPGRDIQ